MSERLDVLKATHDAMRQAYAQRSDYFQRHPAHRRHLQEPPSRRAFLALTRAVDFACVAAMAEGHSAAECAATCGVGVDVVRVRVRRVAQAVRAAQRAEQERAERSARDERLLHEWVLRRRFGGLDKLADGWRPETENQP